MTKHHFLSQTKYALHRHNHHTCSRCVGCYRNSLIYTSCSLTSLLLTHLFHPFPHGILLFWQSPKSSDARRNESHRIANNRKRNHLGSFDSGQHAIQDAVEDPEIALERRYFSKEVTNRSKEPEKASSGSELHFGSSSASLRSFYSCKIFSSYVPSLIIIITTCRVNTSNLVS